jgi:outer membrane immunogenic protein
MKKLLLGALSLAAVSALNAPATAADMRAPMPTKAPMLAPAPAFTWQGFYVGGSLGGRWVDADWTTTNFGIALAPAAPPPLVPQGSASYDSSTVRAGVYAGYNWMFAPNWLLGLEADVAWGDGSKTLNLIPGLGAAGLGDSSSVSHEWDASIRARLGMLLNPNWLLYATGGVAWQHVEASIVCVASCPVINFGGFSIGSMRGTASDTLSGWTLGLGIEGRITGNWIARAEYRYADYGSWNAGFAQNNVALTADIELQTHTALIGLGYKF